MRLPHRRKQVPPPQGWSDRGTEPGNEHESYPYDPEHPDRPYEQVQRDIGTSLLLGAVVLVVLVGLLALGLS
ncbi:hypothetical protein [Oryzihumus sp.]|uniref:hypothetical protein n=1 Tax=Oryzihumus sp. TaxID=1968903 RepID=UPI002ED7DD87